MGWGCVIQTAALDLLLKTSRNASTAKAILMNRAKISSVDLHSDNNRSEQNKRTIKTHIQSHQNNRDMSVRSGLQWWNK
jgi:hypothetical protein